MTLPNEVYSHISGYMVVNCIKIVSGCGVVGYGLSRIMSLHHRSSSENFKDDDDKEEEKQEQRQQQSSSLSSSIVTREYVIGSMIIGLGLFLAVPSMVSEGFLESVAPIVTASDVVGDVASNKYMSYVQSWSSWITKPISSIKSSSSASSSTTSSSSLAATTTSTPLTTAFQKHGLSSSPAEEFWKELSSTVGGNKLRGKGGTSATDHNNNSGTR